MPKIDKKKKIARQSKNISASKTIKTALTKSRPTRSKENKVNTANKLSWSVGKLNRSAKQNTLAYFNCLVDQVANPLNEKVKITQIAHHCRCNKGKVEATREEHKQQLVQELAKNYLSFGESLGHYLHADVVGCAKELKSKNK